MCKPQEIALAFPRGTHQEMCINGILQYAADHDRNWTYVTAPESLVLSILDLHDWDGDGVIAALNTPAESELAKGLAMPVANISSTLVDSPVPRVNVDNRRIGELAADHLLAKGFRSFAFYGLQRVVYSKLRYQGFVSRLEAEGFSATSLLAAPTFGLLGFEWKRQHRALAEWLVELPAPVALFAVTDYRARQAVDACRQSGSRVPQDIAVLGVDNEDFICRNIHPRLSSVSRDNHQEGYRAAALLDRLMHHEESLPVELVPPLHVVERESTSVIAVADERVRTAIDFINHNLQDPLEVDRVARHVDVSRRWLEYAFRDALGESPYQYIRGRRLAIACHLLKENATMKFSDIAKRTGFSSAKQLSATFHEEHGMSPASTAALCDPRTHIAINPLLSGGICFV